MEQNEVKKNKTGLVVLLMVLVLALGGIVGYFVGKSMAEANTEIKEEVKDEEKDEVETEEAEGGDDAEELKEEKLTFDKENLGDGYIATALLNLYGEDMIPSAKRNKSNVLVSTEDKVGFAFYVAQKSFYEQGNVLYAETDDEFDLSISNANVAVQYNSFKDYYKKLFDSELTDDMIPGKYTVKNNYIYGAVLTGVSYWPTVEGIEFVKYGDVYYYRAKATVGESETTYTIQFELEKKDGYYSIKSLIAY